SGENTKIVSAAKQQAAAVNPVPRTPRRKTMSIGVVLEKLQQQSPEVTGSTNRCLESEKLIPPSSTSAGYRWFTDRAVERLRCILTQQRDNYTPLKVSREQLDAMDSGQVTAIVGAGKTSTLVSADKFRAPVITRLTGEDVAEQAGSTEA